MTHSSAVYHGWVRHRRFQPRSHQFRYSLFMMYLDLDELPTLFDPYWAWSTKGPSLAWFRRSDHLGDPNEPLDASVRDAIERELGERPTGKIRLLTHLRYFGYVFNPISIYYCFDREDKLHSLLLEVTNTPWGERHAYVIRASDATGKQSVKTAKSLHVSPFLPMDIEYRFVFSSPGSSLIAAIECWKGDEVVLDATLNLSRRIITSASLARTIVSYPFMTAKVMAAIHGQAFRLWLKRVPIFNHPGRKALEGVSAPCPKRP